MVPTLPRQHRPAFATGQAVAPFPPDPTATAPEARETIRLRVACPPSPPPPRNLLIIPRIRISFALALESRFLQTTSTLLLATTLFPYLRAVPEIPNIQEVSLAPRTSRSFEKLRRALESLLTQTWLPALALAAALDEEASLWMDALLADANRLSTALGSYLVKEKSRLV